MTEKCDLPADDLSKCVLRAMEWFSRNVSAGGRLKKRLEEGYILPQLIEKFGG